MNKPITVATEEFSLAHAELINNSGLPAFLVIKMLQDAIVELQPIARKQYEEDLEVYEKAKQREAEQNEK